jgi:hypothetical protein
MNKHDQTIAYKIMELSPSPSHYKTLFHGNEGSRSIPTDQWVKAQVRPYAKDGTQKTTYASGWHTLPTYQEALDYFAKFKNKENRCIVLCNVCQSRPKAHSPSNVSLSDYIYIIGEVKRKRTGGVE